MARIATVIIIQTLISICCAASAGAAPDRARMNEPFEITADEINYDSRRNLYVADRRVRVVQGGRSLRARWVAFSTETRLGVAEGDVELADGTRRLNAAFMIFDVDTLQGTLYQGELDASESGFHIQAQELIRTGDDTFAMRDGIFTTCRCEEGERVPWALRSADADVELGGYGTLTNSTFDVLGVPVLWIPWVFFPVKSDRETGFLLPDFQFGGRGGFGAGLPFFWAAHPQLNVTVTPRYYVERGFKQDAEFEYVFDERDEGELFVAGLRDMQGGSREAAPASRWALIWKHDQELPARWRWHTDLNLTSDNLYFDDFNEMRHFDSFRYVESTTNVARDFGASGGWGALVGARYADDAQGSRFEDRDEFLIQRFVEARGDALPGTLRGPLGIEARFDSEVIYFSAPHSVESGLNSGLGIPEIRALRTDGRFFDLGTNARFDATDSANQANGENDGIFQPGEPLADRGARVILHPRLARSFEIGRVVEIVPEIGWQETLYRTESRRFAERGLFTARTDLRTRFVRDASNEAGGSTRHIVEPRLGWAFVSQRRQRNNPLFVPGGGVEQTRLRTLALESVTRNPSDRTESTNQLVLALGQRWFSADAPHTAPRLKADLVTAIDWDFEDGDGGLGSIVAQGRVFPVGPLGGRIRVAFDPEAVAFEEGGAELSLSFEDPDGFLRRTSFTGGYAYLRRPPRFFETDVGNSTSFRSPGDSELNQIDFQFRVELAWRIRLTYASIYGLASDAHGSIRNSGMVEYVSKCRCWGFGIQLEHEKRDGLQAGLMIRFMGLGDERSNLFDSGLATGTNF